MDDGDEEVKIESRSETNEDMKDVTPSPPQNGLKRAFDESLLEVRVFPPKTTKKPSLFGEKVNVLKKVLPFLEFADRSHRTNGGRIKYGTTCTCR